MCLDLFVSVVSPVHQPGTPAKSVRPIQLSQWSLLRQSRRRISSNLHWVSHWQLIAYKRDYIDIRGMRLMPAASTNHKNTRDHSGPCNHEAAALKMWNMSFHLHKLTPTLLAKVPDEHHEAVPTTTWRTTLYTSFIAAQAKCAQLYVRETAGTHPWRPALQRTPCWTLNTAETRQTCWWA